MVVPDTSSAVDWLIDGARSAPLPQDVLTELCERLTAGGVPLWRAVVFVRTLHPQVVGRRFMWRPDTGTEVAEAPFELLDREAFRNSPMSRVDDSGVSLRRRLADPACPIDYPILKDLREEGVTDYIISPLRFTDGEVHFASWATMQPGGFTDTQFSAIEAVVAPLARVAEIRAARRVASNLLSTYVGHQAGRAHPVRPDSPRRYRRDSRRDLAVGYARFHQACRPVTATSPGRPPQPLFRLPGPADPRTWRRSSQVHGGRALGHISDRRSGGLRSGVRRRARRGLSRARQCRGAEFGRTRARTSASGSRFTSATFFTAISAAETGWISPVSGRP